MISQVELLPDMSIRVPFGTSDPATGECYDGSYLVAADDTDRSKWIQAVRMLPAADRDRLFVAGLVTFAELYR